MELTNDIIGVQGVLNSTVKTTGDFKRIKFKQGNEDKILTIIGNLQSYLSSKNYIADDIVNSKYEKELEDIVMLLIVNTEMKTPFNLPQYAQFFNITPQLSKCLISNIIFALNLGKFYCKNLEKLQLCHVAEFLHEFLVCLKISKPVVQLDNAFICLKTVATIFKEIEIKENSKQLDDVEAITDIVYEILKNLTGLHSNQTKSWRTDRVFNHMGHTLLRLIDLLLYCDHNNLMLLRVLEYIIRTCCTIMESVTITVFCTWAEVDEDGEPLQSVIAGKSYIVIEKYQNFKPAKELRQMLSTIAKKPKSLNEVIRDSDVPTIIKMINKVDPDQKLWYRALFNTKVLQSKEAMECVSLWSHLSTEDDVMRLLNLSVNAKNSAVTKLIIKCAANLKLPELISVSTRHFYSHGLNHVLNDKIEQQMTILFNKIDVSKNLQEAILFDIHLVLLQNPEKLITYVFEEIFNTTSCSIAFKDVLQSIKEIATIRNIGMKIFGEVVEKQLNCDRKVKSCADLMNFLLEIGYFSQDNFLTKVFLPMLERSKEGDNFNLTNNILIFFKRSNIKLVLKEETCPIFELFFVIMKTYRCNFTNFDPQKQDIVKEVVTIINNVEKEFPFYTGELCEGEDDIYIQYYKDCLLKGNLNSLMWHLYPNFTLDDYADGVSKLIQILPSCVEEEWSLITTGLINISALEKTSEILTDILILLSQIVKTQNAAEDNNPVLKNLKYCLSLYGTITKDKLQPLIKTPQEDVVVVKNVCRLLKQIPTALKNDKLHLVSLLHESTLKKLSKDKAFVCLVASMDDAESSQILAKKMM